MYELVLVNLLSAVLVLMKSKCIGMICFAIMTATVARNLSKQNAKQMMSVSQFIDLLRK
jgi:hypothetical protein